MSRRAGLGVHEVVSLCMPPAAEGAREGAVGSIEFVRHAGMPTRVGQLLDAARVRCALMCAQNLGRHTHTSKGPNGGTCLLEVEGHINVARQSFGPNINGLIQFR